LTSTIDQRPVFHCKSLDGCAMCHLLSRLGLAFVLFWAFGQAAADEPAAPDFVEHVAPIFTKYCTGCHNDTDREGKLSLASFDELQKGGDKGVVVLPGQADSSRLIRVLKGDAEPRMPPEGEPAPSAEELVLLSAWINAGAKGPGGAQPDRKRLVTPRVPPAPGAAERILSLAYSPDGRYLALGRFGSIELRDARSGSTVRRLDRLPGKVSAVCFSGDGKNLIADSVVA
jgi:hypothetical protein